MTIKCTHICARWKWRLWKKYDNLCVVMHRARACARAYQPNKVVPAQKVWSEKKSRGVDDVVHICFFFLPLFWAHDNQSFITLHDTIIHREFFILKMKSSQEKQPKMKIEYFTRTHKIVLLCANLKHSNLISGRLWLLVFCPWNKQSIEVWKI